MDQIFLKARNFSQVFLFFCVKDHELFPVFRISGGEFYKVLLESCGGIGYVSVFLLLYIIPMFLQCMIRNY